MSAGEARFHRLGHAVGIGRRLEDAAADSRDHEMIDAAAVVHRERQRNVRAHGEAQHVRALDPGVIEQRHDVARHGGAVVHRGIVRLVAGAMAAAVEGEAAHALAGDGVVPAHALPVFVFVGREAVHQHDRLLGVGGTEFVVGEGQPVGRELSHDFP